MRTRLSILPLTLALAASCSPTFDPIDEPDAPPDAAPDVAPDVPPDMPPDVGYACRDLTDEIPDGHHYGFVESVGDGNVGECTLACHDGDNGPNFTVAGTLFVNFAGQAPLPGATIFVKDFDGKIVEMVTANNGNFWTQEPLTYPVETWAAACPDVEPMVASVNEPGNCNQGNCHGTNMRVRLLRQ